MKIESILKRANGTTVDFGSQKYHFKPEHPGGPHVAEVADEGHAERLLAIREGYRAVDKKAAAPTPPVEPPAPGVSHVLQGNGGAEQAGASTDTGAPAEQRNEGGDAPPAADGAQGEVKAAETKPAAKRGRPAKAK